MVSPFYRGTVVPVVEPLGVFLFFFALKAFRIRMAMASDVSCSYGQLGNKIAIVSPFYRQKIARVSPFYRRNHALGKPLRPTASGAIASDL